MCSKNAKCPGKEIIDVNYGYWRLDNRSDILAKCVNWIENCKGGPG